MASYTLVLYRPILSAQVLAIQHRVGSKWQRLTANQARQDSPVRTGHLGRSVAEGDVTAVGPYTTRASVKDTAHYALYVHEGTRPHIIRPVRARMLVFDVGGRTVFARIVHHPGTRARPFLRNAGERVAAQIAGG